MPQTVVSSSWLLVIEAQGGYITSDLWVNKVYTVQYPITLSRTAFGFAGQPASNTTSVCLVTHTESTMTIRTAEVTGYSWFVLGV